MYTQSSVIPEGPLYMTSCRSQPPGYKVHPGREAFERLRTESMCNWVFALQTKGYEGHKIGEYFSGIRLPAQNQTKQSDEGR